MIKRHSDSTKLPEQAAEYSGDRDASIPVTNWDGKVVELTNWHNQELFEIKSSALSVPKQDESWQLTPLNLTLVVTVAGFSLLLCAVVIYFKLKIKSTEAANHEPTETDLEVDKEKRVERKSLVMESKKSQKANYQ